MNAILNHYYHNHIIFLLLYRNLATKEILISRTLLSLVVNKWFVFTLHMLLRHTHVCGLITNQTSSWNFFIFFQAQCQVNIIGRIGTDPETVMSKQGKSFVAFKVATNRGRKYIFSHLELWCKLAKTLKLGPMIFHCHCLSTITCKKDFE